MLVHTYLKEKNDIFAKILTSLQINNVPTHFFILPWLAQLEEEKKVQKKKDLFLI